MPDHRRPARRSSDWRSGGMWFSGGPPATNTAVDGGAPTAGHPQPPFNI
ncbi:hypothetical protein A2U01_0051814 [Trifolium medium]|uniref:Uncharacterized protein n=1 Tax=Trifolium medium TaxID=97028 RepID=A0A392R3C8_9FABA|nr:hypothetical protein [Trifolium medium]